MTLTKRETGERLLAERRRLKLVQDAMAAMGGVGKRAYCNYESGERECGSNFLSKLGYAGVDVQFILTGIRSTTLPTFQNQSTSELEHAVESALAALSRIKALATNF